jgi:cytochrome P450
MFDTLLTAESKGLIDSEGVREEVDTFTFEGYGTTGMCIVFTLLLLAHHPEAQGKILLEVKETQGEKNGSKKFTMKDLNDMSYLDCVIKESLRLYPPVPYFARTLTEDLELGLTI